MKTLFQKHEVVWTDEKIKNFWSAFDSSVDYFSKAASRQIFGLAKKYLKKDGNNLDYGCGEGDLIRCLLERGISCQGLDYSDKSLARVKEEFAGDPLFKGVVLGGSIPNKDIAAGTYDFIFSIEMLEHVLPEQVTSILDEFFRILRPGGYLFITVPNNEKLSKYKTTCPDCGAVFHYMQHLNSFSTEKLDGLMRGAGFEKIFCQATFLGRGQNIFHEIKYSLSFLLAKIFKRKPFRPHLIYLGRKHL